MKPERTRDQLKSAGIARARMYLKGHLEWLDGAPVAQSAGQIQWKLRPQVGALTAETVLVDRELLRQSQAVLQKLARHFPKALPKLVGDVAEWSARVASILDRLKSAVHDDVDIVSDAATPIESLAKRERIVVEQLSRQHSSLIPLLQIVIWFGWYRPAVRSDLLLWIAENAEWVEEYLKIAGPESGHPVILLAADLARTEPDTTSALIRSTLAEISCYKTVTVGLGDEIKWFTKQLRDWRNPKSIPTRPRQIKTTTFGTHVALFFHWLAAQDQPIRQRAMRLATLVLSVPLIRQWRASWDKYHSAAHTAIRWLCQQNKNHIGHTAFHSEACRLAFELENELAEEPPRFPISEILDCVKQISRNNSARFNQACCDLLAAVSVNQPEVRQSNDGIKLRLALLREATEIRTEHQGIRYFELSSQFLRSSRDSNRLRPWQGLILSWDRKAYCWTSLRNTLFDELPRHAQWIDYFSLLTRVIANPNYNYSLNDELAWLLVASSTVDQAYLRFTKLLATGVLDDCTKSQVLAAIELESDGFTLGEALDRIGPNSQIDSSRLDSILKLHRHFQAAGWPDAIHALLRMNRATDLTQVALQFQIANTKDDSVPFVQASSSSRVPEWADHLPLGLQSQIAVYAAAFPNSRSRIQKVLDKYFPDPQQLQNEIEVLQQLQQFTSDITCSSARESSAVGLARIPLEVKRQRRLANLQQRLHHPLPVSESAVLGLRRQLQDALVVDLFHDARARIVARLSKLLGGRAELKEFSHHILPVRYLELASGILRLDEPYRSYGLRLLRKCWGNVAWDLQSEPPNRRFLDGIIARGIRVERWLDHYELIVAATDLHPRLTLAFESNEAEQLLMGYYFGTCLSPDGINFFSALANGIDINKRVVYARDPKGEVVGRCLFAIGDVGTIVVFRPYWHDNQIPFEQYISQFASDLANAMGTVVSHTDHVSPLLSPDWYDDGAYDLGNSIAAEDSPLRSAIRTATEETLISSLQAVLAPIGLNESMLEIVVQLPELAQRPQLLRLLIPMIKLVEKGLGVSTLMMVAKLAHQAGMRNIAVEILRRYSFDWIRRQMIHGGYLEAMETLKILIAYHPSIALRCLRETRQRHIHRDEDENDADRRRLIAECLHALGRVRLATEMRQHYRPN